MKDIELLLFLNLAFIFYCEISIIFTRPALFYQASKIDRQIVSSPYHTEPFYS